MERLTYQSGLSHIKFSAAKSPVRQTFTPSTDNFEPKFGRMVHGVPPDESKDMGKETAKGLAAGAATGAGVGAAIGSVVPGFGTAVGALCGGLVGALCGGVAGLEKDKKKKR